jgi:hypothetical protein
MHVKAETLSPGGSSRTLRLAGSILVLVLPLLFLELMRLLNAGQSSASGLLGRAAFVLACLGAAWASQAVQARKSLFLSPLALLAVAGAAGTVLWLGEPVWAGWVFLGAFYALLLLIGDYLPGKLRWLGIVVLAAAAGAVPAAWAQIETRFSEEEFMAAFLAAILTVFWLILNWAWRTLRKHLRVRVEQTTFLPARAFWGAALAVGLLGTLAVGLAYQGSFYPAEAPLFAGISEENPFLCGEVEGSAAIYSGPQVYEGLLERVEANPRKGPPEYALLALGRGDEEHLAAFKHSLLEEAELGAFTEPARSIKYGQYQAAMRVYYYVRVQEAYPELFSAEEEQRLKAWFSAINRRAQTVEWVDWMYALAFNMRPWGPYENQKTGAGLISLLERYGLGDPQLSEENSAYLAARGGGWEAGFRNTDDAILYQPEWLNNAYFQSLYRETANTANLERSFEWLLLQSPPDGSPLSYNHIGAAHLAAPSYLGGVLLEDEQLVWLAGRSLNYLQKNDLPLSARPGMEQVLEIDGRSPQVGSCAIFGGSGVPTRSGPLAPDKLVFRDGWEPDSNYLLLNLRFSGWHRYKATNAVVLAYQGGPLVKEVSRGTTAAWLPEGRSLFRDKRIPRENLNGLVIPRRGMNAVLNRLTGLGSPWAQDPPHYARLERFETLEGVDISSSVIEDWHGWTHRRSVYFYHEGPIVVIDEARGPGGEQPAVLWHISGGELVEGSRVVLRGGDRPAQLLLLAVQPGSIEAAHEEDGLRLVFLPEQRGRLALATVFLTGEWSQAETSVDEGQQAVRIRLAEQELLIPLEGGQ